MLSCSPSSTGGSSIRIRTTKSADCAITTPAPFTPTWQTVIDFLDSHVKR
jgi:hypothetical protein